MVLFFLLIGGKEVHDGVVLLWFFDYCKSVRYLIVFLRLMGGKEVDHLVLLFFLFLQLWRLGDDGLLGERRRGLNGQLHDKTAAWAAFLVIARAFGPNAPAVGDDDALGDCQLIGSGLLLDLDSQQYRITVEPPTGAVAVEKTS